MSRCVFLYVATLLLGMIGPLRLAADQNNLDALGSNALVTPTKPDAKPVAPVLPPIPPPPRDPTKALISEALMLIAHGKTDEALEKANALIQMAPQNPDSYGLRGSIYTETKQWDLATKDFKTVLQLDPRNEPAVFNLAEIKFRQKQYASARTDFTGLIQSPLLGELARYKVFLCDLYGGNDALAKKELDAFKAVGSGPGFYFGNAAWYLYHKQMDEGRNWLVSAVKIYSQDKVNLYAASLKDLGYLPLPTISTDTP